MKDAAQHDARGPAGRREPSTTNPMKGIAMTEGLATVEEASPHTAFVIIVNAVPDTVESPLVSYEQVVRIAYPTPPSPDTRFTVTYRKAVAPNHEGSLVAGQSVEVKKKGTIFNVKATGRS